MIENTLVYEQPLNELIRVCLRIEQLFLQIDHQIHDTSIFGTRNIVAAIINMLQLLDRPDLKAKLAKELTHQISGLLRLANTPHIDQNKLQALLKELEALTRCFIDNSKKLGQGLREVDLLNNLRLHLASPGGGCSFDIPVYHYWLHRPAEERLSIIKVWLQEFDTIRSAISLILQLIREGSKALAKSAEHGFYQELLDPQVNLRMIRIFLPHDLSAYPEISIGRHFLSVRFFEPNILNRPIQSSTHIAFWISHCSA